MLSGFAPGVATSGVSGYGISGYVAPPAQQQNMIPRYYDSFLRNTLYFNLPQRQGDTLPKEVPPTVTCKEWRSIPWQYWTLLGIVALVLVLLLRRTPFWDQLSKELRDVLTTIIDGVRNGVAPPKGDEPTPAVETPHE